MKSTLTETDVKVIILGKYEVTPHEDFFINILLRRPETRYFGEIERYLKALERAKAKVNFTELVASLQQKGIVEKSYILPSEWNADVIAAIPFTSDFIVAQSAWSAYLCQELLSHYPHGPHEYGTSDLCLESLEEGQTFQDVAHQYAQSVLYDRYFHDRIIKVVEVAKAHKYPFITFPRFVALQLWNHIEDLIDLGVFPSSEEEIIETGNVLSARGCAPCLIERINQNSNKNE